MSLIYKGHSWYLCAFCRLKNDFRNFRVSGIKNIDIQKEKFKKRIFNYHDYVKEVNKKLKRVRLVLKFSPEVKNIVEDYMDIKDISALKDGFLRVTTNIPDGDWLYAMLLGCGDKVEVIEPVEVRKKIIEKLINCLKIYELDVR